MTPLNIGEYDEIKSATAQLMAGNFVSNDNNYNIIVYYSTLAIDASKLSDAEYLSSLYSVTIVNNEQYILSEIIAPDS